jgi:hypothetical protein
MDEGARNADAEIAAIFTRLQNEVRRRPGGVGERRTEPVARVALPARAQAERAWAVSAERPIELRPGGSRSRRAVFAPVKRVLRKLMRWYVEPVAAQQRAFNLAILTLVDELAERTEADVNRLERRLEALEARLAAERVQAGE